MPSPIVVTGASGFVGKALLNRLRRLDIPVVGLARSGAIGDDVIEVGDYAEYAPPPNACLVHLAQDREYAADARFEAENDEAIGLFRRLLEKPWQRIIYVSSAMLYGDKESYPRHPGEEVVRSSAYLSVKHACEEMTLSRGGCVTRMSNLYGHGMAPNSVLSDILSQVPGSGPVAVRDDTPVRDFLWVDDTADCLALEATQPHSGIYNVGSGRGTSIRALAERVLSIVGEENRDIVAPAPAAPGSYLILDISLTTDTFQWTPEVPLRDGLKRLIKTH